MFKVNNKDTRTTPFTPCSSVSIVNFKHVIITVQLVKFTRIIEVIAGKVTNKNAQVKLLPERTSYIIIL